MKLTKLSLIATLALTTAMAGDAKIGGDAKLFYGTTDAGDADLFNKNGATGDSAVTLDYSREVADGVTVNVGVTGISTLGLEDTLVSGTWVPHNRHDKIIKKKGEKDQLKVKGDNQDAVWIDTANIVLKPIDKTMLVVGRQTLDTPLAFTETWNIAENTFDAAVAVDTHIPKTTLIAAWVGRGNGHNGYENLHGGMGKYGALNAGQASATEVANKGAFAAAAITTAIPMTTAQLWFYNVRNQADAIWLQADVTPTKEVSVGLQYSKISPKGGFEGKDDTTAFAGKLGYKVAGVDLAAAYSKVDDKGLVYMGNTATAGAHGGQSKLYTEAWWNYNFVGQAGAKSMMVSAGYDTFTAQYTSVKNSNSNLQEMDEVTLTASKKLGPLDTTLVLINTSSDDKTVDGNTVQVYLTVPFSL